MKTWKGILIILACSRLAFGQGQFVFNNRVPPDINARFQLDECAPPFAGNDYIVQLSGGPTGTPSADLAVLGTTTFRTGAAAGYVNPITVTVPNVPGGRVADIVIRVYTAAGTIGPSLATYGPYTVWLTAVPGTPPNLALGVNPLVAHWWTCGLADNWPVQTPHVRFLSVTPSDRLITFGEKGGPFIPSSKTYTISNLGEGTLEWSVSADRDWVTLSPTRGQNSGAVNVSINENARALAFADTATIRFRANGEVDQRMVQLMANYPNIQVDFNGDRLPDLLFQNHEGLIAYWSMKGSDVMQTAPFYPTKLSNPAWNLIGYGDFDGDRRPDLVFQYADGTLVTWLMVSPVRGFTSYFGPTSAAWSSGPEWHLAGVRDINGDEKPDLIFQHTDGWLAAWIMDGTNVVTVAPLHPNHPGDPGWKVAGTGKLNPDGKWDLFFQHDDGTLAVWEMDSLEMIAPYLLQPSAPDDPNWRIMAVADLDSDGISDLVFEHRSEKSLAVWFMRGIESREAVFLHPRYTGPTWKMVGPK